MGPLRFERKTSRLSAERSTCLSYGPEAIANITPCNLNLIFIRDCKKPGAGEFLCVLCALCGAATKSTPGAQSYFIRDLTQKESPHTFILIHDRHYSKEISC
jgi:hypothetical protein